MDKTTLFGLTIGFGAVLLGQFFEGGHIADMIQGTAALIVLGGTFGAVLVSTSLEDLKNGITLTKSAFFCKDHKINEVISDTLSAVQTMNSGNLVDLEKKIATFHHPEVRNVFRLVADGVDAQGLREIVEAQIIFEESRLNAGAKIWSDAGGFAPTIGILGAVLGLIHVMGNLSDTSKLGEGIAVAFVATIYGVAFANLFFLPLGNKLKSVIQNQLLIKEMVLEGALASLEGKTPYVVREKLKAFLIPSQREKE